MKTKISGFTLIEVMITITIIGILSATVSMSISRYVLERKGEQHVMAFYNQLQQMRAYAQRNNVRYIVELEPAGFNIFRDDARNFNLVNSEILFQEQNSTARLIRFGQGAANPDAMPAGEDIYDVGGNIIGDWLSGAGIVTGVNLVGDDNGGFTETPQLGTRGYNAIVFENDAIGTITPGILFLENNNIPEVCYAIVRPLNENVLRLWKWKSGTWTEL